MWKLVINEWSVRPVPEVNIVTAVKSWNWVIVLFRFYYVSTVVPGPQSFYKILLTPVHEINHFGSCLSFYDQQKVAQSSSTPGHCHLDGNCKTRSRCSASRYTCIEGKVLIGRFCELSHCNSRSYDILLQIRRRTSKWRGRCWTNMSQGT